jgi:agmatinase
VTKQHGPASNLPLVPFTFLGLGGKPHTFNSAPVAVLPVPYDATASFKAGARDGPYAIISSSRELEDYDIELGCEPSSIGIFTAPALEPNLGSPQLMVEQVAQAVSHFTAQGQILAMLGGDHSITIGGVTALAATHDNLSVLYLDAHADFRDEYLGTRWGHASAARRVSEVCPTTLVGVRSLSTEEANALKNSTVRLFPAQADGVVAIDAINDSLSEKVYVSVDLDVLDPSFMPTVGTPEPGGLSWHDVVGLLRQVAERHTIVGFDVVELVPQEGPAAAAYIAAKLVYKLIGYSTVLGPSVR